MKRKWLIILLAVLCILSAAVVYRGQLLGCLGRFLLSESAPQRSDVIVILRGDWDFSRTMTAARLYHEGYADRMLISTSLPDEACRKLVEHGVFVPCGQGQIRDILIQLGVPGENIVLGYEKPGGGTLGEAYRIRKMMKTNGFQNALVVTSWWHTRRAQTILDHALAETDMEASVTGARTGAGTPSDWFKYRYVAISVLEEMPKLGIFWLSFLYNLVFNDDPHR